MPRQTTTAALIALMVASTNAAAQSNASPFLADSGPARDMEAPSDPRPVTAKTWWSQDWFERGQLPVPVNHEVEVREVSYVNPTDKTEVPALLFKPKGSGRYPAVLFAHGRRGLDELIRHLPLRLAARGFVVLAPNLFAARFIETMPIAHQTETEGDLTAGLDHLLALPEVSTSKACLASHTRGGYYTLRTAVAHARQDKDVACYVSTYPHWQNPNAPEPDQVYRHAPEAEKLTIPTLVMIGELEQYQRRRSIESAIAALKAAGRPASLLVYPGVGRGFDFRGANVRTFADDLAAKDAVQRAGDFLALHLAPHTRR